MNSPLISQKRQALTQALSEAAALDERIARLRIEIDAMQAVYEELRGPDAQPKDAAPSNKPATEPAPAPKPPEKRRMRLGAKKRAIYVLMKNGFGSVDEIAEKLGGSDIKRGYARDVVRSAFDAGDLTGDIDGQFEMTKEGKKILALAPIPSGWRKYSYFTKVKKDKASTTRVEANPEGVAASLGI